jgi:hypothetical protein
LGVASAERNWAYRIFIYYLVAFSGLLLLGKLFPEIQQFMASTAIGINDNQLQLALQNGSIVQAPVADAVPVEEPTLFNHRALALLISLCSTVIFTVPLAWTFKLSHPSEQSRSIRETIFLLPITVTSVVVVVQHSIALAFSLAGVVAAVRFRSNIKTPADAMFVFAALAIGLAAGVSEIAVAGIGSMFFCFTYIALRMTGVVQDDVVSITSGGLPHPGDPNTREPSAATRDESAAASAEATVTTLPTKSKASQQ